MNYTLPPHAREVIEARQSMSARKFHHFVIIAAAAVTLVSACAQSTRVVKTFEDPAYEGRSFSKFLVVGVDDDYVLRQLFEEELVAVLRSSGVEAVASHMQLVRSEPVNRDTVIAAVDRAGADAVLVTRLKSVDRQTQIKGGREEMKVTRKDGSAFDLFRYDYDVLSDPEIITVTATVVITTDLYAVAERAKIWSVDSTSFDNESAGEAMEAESDAIVAQLRRDGLLAR